MKLTKEYLNNLFDYKDGNLFKKNNPNKVVGNIDKYGYIRIKISEKYYFVHRLIYMMHYGYFPETIDHIDNNKSNNKIENLRECNKSQNSYNSKINSRNTSGAKNVYWHKQKNKWFVRLVIDRKNKHIGYFDTFENANLAAQKARETYQGTFVRHS